MNLVVAILAATLLAQTGSSMSADDLAERVMKANGGEVWPKVTRVKYTFVMHGKERPQMRIHNWDVKNHTDTVNVGSKTMTARLNAPNDTDEAKRAFGAWTNDTYWLMAPLKVMDAGVKRALEPDETIDGKAYHVLHLSFESVGMTPTDQYKLYVDPRDSMVRYWDYIPAVGEPKRFTWEEYHDYNGVKFATKHKVGERVVLSFINIEVTKE